MSPATAAKLGGISTRAAGNGHHTDVVELKLGGRSVKAAAWVLPGQADDVVTVHLGYGRTRAGQVGTGIGFAAYALRTSDAPWSAAGLEVAKTGESQMVACTQDHWTMDNQPGEQAKERHVVRTLTLAELAQEPERAARGRGPRAGPRASRCSPSTSTRATPGACRST